MRFALYVYVKDGGRICTHTLDNEKEAKKIYKDYENLGLVVIMERVFSA